MSGAEGRSGPVEVGSGGGGTRADPELERVRIEWERLEFEKELAARSSPMQKHLGAIVTAAVTLIVAVLSATQVWTTRIANEKDHAIAQAQNEAHMDQRWRTEMLGFLERQQPRLFSEDEDEASDALALLELSFPAMYVKPVRSKLQVLRGPHEAANDDHVVELLLAPLIAAFDRTKEASRNYRPGNLKAEDALRDGNRRARDLLIEHSVLIPEGLRADAARLVEHYEEWLQEYARLRTGDEPDLSSPVYAGPRGYPFPSESERHFRAEYERLRGGAAGRRD